MLFRINCKVAKDDPEKLVIPGILWVKIKEDNAIARAIFIGWWHWSIGIIWGNKIS